MNNTKELKPRFKVGDWVSFPYGAMSVVAQIIEDRGPIGAKGRRLYRIQTSFPTPDGEPDRYEVPEENMTTANAPPNTAKAS